MQHDDLNLLEKTELTIKPVLLSGADLNQIANAVAEVLQLEPRDVFVIDSIGDELTLDILKSTVGAEQLAGQSAKILKALALIDGLEVSDDTQITSKGILNWVGMEPKDVHAILSRTKTMMKDISENISKRALIISTGDEVVDGQIKDTNKPYIMQQLSDAGFSPIDGGSLRDDINLISHTFREAAEERGFGLIISTGGVGAETKDCTIEALLSVDKLAATEPIMHVKKGHGRHVKSTISIGVGMHGTSIIVCFPGPHSEVKLGLAELLTGLENKSSHRDIAKDIAKSIRAKFKNTFTQ